MITHPRTLFFRTDLASADAYMVAAKAGGTTLSGWLREAARMRLPDGGTSLPPLPRSPRRRPVRIPSDDVVAVSGLTGEVGRLTGATIQLARSLREIGHASEHETIETILRDLRAAQADLVRIGDRLRATEAIE
ncbi:hypothetical protein KQX62_11970 [Rhodopseudomonas palustris]|uniref:Uncharacterized protein n=1 Tax=Rhodopseudomonas palustris TaxID=1076 RepID=A0AAX3E4T7_RHOPL|nr:hypothetical protein [Rhodopseudomonas palustris]UYO41958.1 hypothetical protein KQX62_11970 [Rhodopseudomonas palustris]